MSSSTPRTIPAGFIKLDDAVTSADRFVNVRDRQIMRANQNALFSGAHFRVAHTATSTGANNASLRHIHHRQYGIDTSRQVPILYNTRVRLSQYCRECSFVIYASTSRALDFAVYPVLSRPGDQRDIVDAQSVTVNTATAALLTRYAVTITVPYTSVKADGFHEYDYTVYAHPIEQGATILGAPDTLSAASSTSVTAATGPHAGFQNGDIMYFPSNTLIEARFIEQNSFIPLSVNRTWDIDERAAWIDQIPTLTDTVQLIESPELNVATCQLIEVERTTDFDTLLELI